MRISLTLAVAGIAAGALLAQGPGPATGGAKQVSLSIPNEMAPPGGVAQMKFMVTEPTPISSGKPISFYDTGTFDDVWGIELFCTACDLNGVAMVKGSQVSVLYTTTAGPQGTDYPIMTMALHVRPDAIPGSQTTFALDPSSTWVLGLLGTATLKPGPPATVRVGGSISITNVVPGGGLLPAGTVVSVRGIGFQPKTQVQLNSIKFSSIVVVGPEEIQFTLAEATNMTGKKIQVVNPDGSQDTYFSYMRGVMLGQSNESLLSNAVPIFSPMTYSQGVFAPLAYGSGKLFSGVALQNPNQVAVDITVSLFSPDAVLLGSSITHLPGGYRMMREVSEITGGAQAVFGSYLVVNSTAPVQMFGFVGDHSTNTVTPFSAALAQP